MEFRPCPSYPGYSATQCGVIRRDDRAGGKPLAQNTDKRRPSVYIGSPRKRIRVSDMVADAFPTPGASTYFTGWTLAEEYRPVPSSNRHEVSLAGRIRVRETLREITIYTLGGRDVVYLGSRNRHLQAVINEAWPECAIPFTRTRRGRVEGELLPASSYPDGRVITLAEYRMR